MSATLRSVLTIGAGLLAVLLVAIGGGLWWASSLHSTQDADAATAARVFAEVRASFPGVTPALVISDGRLVVLREPPASPSSEPNRAQLLVWEPRELRLSRVSVPLWVSVLATEPLPLDALIGLHEGGVGAFREAQRRGTELNIRMGDLERYGRTLLIDGVTPDGKQILMWNE